MANSFKGSCFSVMPVFSEPALSFQVHHLRLLCKTVWFHAGTCNRFGSNMCLFKNSLQLGRIESNPTRHRNTSRACITRPIFCQNLERQKADQQLEHLDQASAVTLNVKTCQSGTLYEITKAIPDMMKSDGPLKYRSFARGPRQ